MQNFTRRFLESKPTFLYLLAFLFSLSAIAQKPMEKRSFEISLEADEAIQTEIKNNKRINIATGQPVALYGLNYEVPAGTPEAMAQYYLNKESVKLGIPVEEIENLRHHATRTTNAGSVVRFRQYYNSYPVNKSEVTIAISPQNKVVYVMNSFAAFKNIDTTPSVSAEQALEIAKNHIGLSGPVMFQDNSLMIYSNQKMTKLAHEVTILTSDPMGEWHVFVDAQTQEVFKAVDMNHYYCGEEAHSLDCNHNKPPVEMENFRFASGTGFIFNPDPLSSNMVAYGGGYVDGGDVNTTQLDAARFSVTLNDITLSGGMYSLVGPRAEIIDFDAPNTGLFAQASSDFSFNRQDQGFEPVNVYYHIDFMMNYINNTLGCDITPYQYAGGVQFDPHGANGADNSYYTGGAGRLSFGEGCVDDGEDSDVIHHELGHGLHDWVTSGGLSQTDGLSEGCGDYVAQSYNRSLGNWTSADPQYQWVFNWDGHNECWGGRVTNHNVGYPGGLVGQIHTDGQIWASCLMAIWDQIGQQEMDKIFYEGLGMTNGSSNQNDAANAVYQAAINLGYTNAQLNTIHSGLESCGYTLPALPGPPIAAASADVETICLDTNNTVNFTDDTSPDATSWSWTFEGGTPATSTDQNPTVTYTADGTYDVTLVATNSFGTDTVVLTDYISVVSGAACPACETPSSGTVSLDIPDGVAANSPGAPLEHTINIANDFVIDYVKVSVDIQHTYINDLIIDIIHPDGTTSVTIWDRSCAGQNDLNVTFEDGAIAIACAEPTEGTYAPVNPLSAFSGLNSAGDWKISITDNWNVDVGQLNVWSLEVCGEPTASIDEDQFEMFSLFPNPNNGDFTIALNSYSNQDISVQVYDIRGRSIFNKAYNNTSDFNQVINLNNAQSGMYLVKVSDGDKETIKKIVIE